MTAWIAGRLDDLVEDVRGAINGDVLSIRRRGHADIERPVHLFQGEKDRNVPPSMGRYQAQALPNCRAHFYPEEGHISLVINRLDEILAVLLAPHA